MELLIIALLTVVNGVLAMSEAALIASRKPRLVQRAQNGQKGATAALKLTDSPERFLSTVQIGITLIGILAGAFGGATVANDFAKQIEGIAMLQPYADTIGIAIVVGITTYLSLVIGELVPKNLAIRQPETIISLIAPTMRRLSNLVAPIAWFLDQSTNMMLWLLNAQQNDEPSITEAEITVMVQEGHHEGIFQQHEKEMVESVFRLDVLMAEALMTPRTEIEWLNINDESETWRGKVLNAQHSHLLVQDKDDDDIIGFVKVRDILTAMLQGGTINLRELCQAPTFIPRTLPAPAILETLRNEQNKIAIVIGEFGGTLGVITLQDVVEAVIGDIDTSEAIQRGDDSWLIDGLMPIEEFKSLLDLKDLPDEESYHTVAGFVINQFDAIPEAAETFNWNGWQVEVVDMDGNRVDKVLMKKITPGETDS